MKARAKSTGSSLSLKKGRVAQKRRTRQNLLEAGLRVVDRGDEPTLEAVAEEADVSRATAYRYFPRIQSLLSVLPLAHLVEAPESILEGVAPDDAVAGAVRVQNYFYDLAADNELAFRRFLHATLDEYLRQDPGEEYTPLRGHYRLKTLDRALAALEDRVDAATLAHLRVVLVVLGGIEALISVKDVCGLDAKSGRESLAWAARALVEAAIAR